jgi:ubiquinone/menaquinone biosynthesis C-methylase UbiE
MSPGRRPHHRTHRGKHTLPSELRTDWSRVAEWYDQLVGEAGSEYHREVVLPGVVKLLAPNRGERVLDVACGQGVLCRILREQGVEPTGVDAAPPLIKLARERSDPSIRFHVGDARELDKVPALQAETFRGAACVLAIQNIHPLPPVCEGVARLLEPGGRFVIAMMHPCFRGPKATSWRWDQQAGVQYRRVDRYLVPRKEPIVTHPGSAPDEYTWTFHRPLQAYVSALSKAGLFVDALEEWPSHKVSTSGPRAPAENKAREEIPMFLALRAVKIQNAPH